MRPVPAGWYPAPATPSRMRFFDGNTWTGEVKPLSSQHPDGRCAADATVDVLRAAYPFAAPAGPRFLKSPLPGFRVIPWC
jgi:hypothetical protein